MCTIITSEWFKIFNEKVFKTEFIELYLSYNIKLLELIYITLLAICSNFVKYLVKRLDSYSK